MKLKRMVLVCTILAFIGAGMVLMLRRSPRGDLTKTRIDSVIVANGQSSEIHAATTVVQSLQLPNDPRPEVQLLYKLAKAANFYGFNPEIVYHKTNSHPPMIDVGTPTHGATITGGIIDRAYSYFDGSDVRRKPEAAKDWYLCTGKWTEKEAIAETLRILEKLGETSALAKLSEGRQECEAVEMRVVTPLGETVKVTPFYNVRLSNKGGRCIVQAEYRIGTNGPVGLTDWYFWP